MQDFIAAAANVDDANAVFIYRMVQALDRRAPSNRVFMTVIVVFRVVTLRLIRLQQRVKRKQYIFFINQQVHFPVKVYG